VYVRSVYFQDPDGILLEFACWMRGFISTDVSHAPARAAHVHMAAEPELPAQPTPV
jgi:hypothetical protein